MRSNNFSLLTVVASMFVTGCWSGEDVSKTTPQSDLQTVRIEFTGFMKAKSGAI